MFDKNFIEDFDSLEGLEDDLDKTNETIHLNLDEIYGTQDDFSESEDLDRILKKYSVQPIIHDDTLFILLSIDSEFTNEEVLTLQCYVNFSFFGNEYKFHFILINKKYKKIVSKSLFFKQSSKKTRYRDFYYFFVDFQDCMDPILIKYFFYLLYKRYLIPFHQKILIFLYFYFSPKDLIISLGKKILHEPLSNQKKTFNFFKKSKIYSRRNINGTLYMDYFDSFSNIHMNLKIQLKDMFGLDNYGLKSLIESVGINTQTKNLLDDYKTKMDVALQTKTNEFLEYAFSDASVLLTVLYEKIKNNNKILKETFKITNPDYYFNIYNFPLTVGTLVDLIWDKYFDFVIFKDSSLYKLAFLKFGILETRHPNYKKNLELFDHLKKIKSLDQFFYFKESEIELYEDMVNYLLKKNVFRYIPTQYGSIKYLIDISVGGANTYLLAMTTGGRTVNERPREIAIEYGADVDVQSAYGSQLVVNYYPIGKPRIYAKSPNSTQKITLKNFLTKHYSKLQKYKMFYILVSGDLSFEQDLIHSKIPHKSYMNKVENFMEIPVDKQAISSDFVLLRKQIINGVITQSTLEILQKVSTSAELNEIHNLEVIAALYYYDADCTFSIKEILNEFLKDSGSYSFDSTKSAVTDTRTFKTFLFPIRDIVGTLLSQRLDLKKQIKTDPNAKSLSNSLKLIINTLWGDFTSIFFKTSNVLASQQVVNSIRNYVWMLSKPLGTVMSITDGGPYSLMEVFSLKENEKKPGLNTLSSYYKIKKHRSFITHPLAHINWKSYIECNIPLFASCVPNIDVLCLKHVRDFWKPYDLKFQVLIEHKMERSFKICSYIGKAHYMMLIYDSEKEEYSKEIYVIRGFKYDPEIKHLYPTYLLLKYILYNHPNYPSFFVIENNFIYEQMKLVKINSWRLTLIKTNHKNFKFVSSLGPDVWPGDSIMVQKDFRMWNTHCYILNLEEYKRKAKRSLRTTKIKNEDGKIITKKIHGFELVLINKGVYCFLDAINTDNFKIVKKQ